MEINWTTVGYVVGSLVLGALGNALWEAIKKGGALSNDWLTKRNERINEIETTQAWALRQSNAYLISWLGGYLMLLGACILLVLGIISFAELVGPYQASSLVFLFAELTCLIAVFACTKQARILLIAAREEKAQILKNMKTQEATD